MDLCDELKKAGVTLHLPCVNVSCAKVNLSGTDAYLGFVGVQGLEDKVIAQITTERQHCGPYHSLEEFVRRNGITLDQCLILIRIGAMRFTGKTKKDLLWEIYGYFGGGAACKSEPELFASNSKTYTLPELLQSKLEDAYDELELLSYPVSLSMFELLESRFRGEVMAKDLKQHISRKIKMLGNYAAEKTIRTIKGQRMYFGNFLDFEGNWFDTVHFPQAAPIYPFQGMGCYLIYGRVTEDFGFCSIEVEKFAKLSIKPDPRQIGV